MRDEIVPCIGRDLYDATGVHLRYLVSRQEHLNTDHFKIPISVIDHGFRGLEKNLRSICCRMLIWAKGFGFGISSKFLGSKSLVLILDPCFWAFLTSQTFFWYNSDFELPDDMNYAHEYHIVCQKWWLMTNANENLKSCSNTSNYNLMKTSREKWAVNLRVK